MDDTQPKAKYLVLNHAIPAAFKERLLGCVVNDMSDPYSGFQPEFARSDDNDTPLTDYGRLKALMNGFLSQNPHVGVQDDGKFKNQVNLKDLLTEKVVAGDVTVEGNLTKLLKTHYGHKDKRNFEIEAATGKRYHLHNAIYEFKKRLWSNEYYRQTVQEVIDQKRDDETLQTLNSKTSKAYGMKSTRHKCEVVLLPMVVGILTCEEVKVKVLDDTGRQHGAGVQVPIDTLAGTQTGGMLDTGFKYEASKSTGGHTTETIPDEVIVALAYDMIAISAGHSQGSAQPESRGFFSKMLGLSSPSTPKSCPACEENKLPYPAAWRHAPVRTNNSRGINMNMSEWDNNSSHNSSTASLPRLLFPEDSDYEEDDLADSPVELYVAPHSDHYVLAEDLDPRLSPSSTGSTVKSTKMRIGGKEFEILVEGTKEMGLDD